MAKTKEFNLTTFGGAVVIITIALIAFVGFVYSYRPNPITADCSIELDYGVQGNESRCWNAAISKENCPMPTKISCNVGFSASSVMLEQMMRDIDDEY